MKFWFGGIPTPLKNMSSSIGMMIPNIWKNKKCSKPPTRQAKIMENSMDTRDLAFRMENHGIDYAAIDILVFVNAP